MYVLPRNEYVLFYFQNLSFKINTSLLQSYYNLLEMWFISKQYKIQYFFQKITLLSPSVQTSWSTLLWERYSKV